MTNKKTSKPTKVSTKSKPKPKGKYIEKGIRFKPVPKVSSDK